MSRRIGISLTLVLLVLPLLMACGPQAATRAPATATAASATSSAGSAQAATPAPVTIVLKNFAFDPKQVTVPVGTTVVWTNRDAASHTVTAGTRGSPSGLFDSGNLASGASFSFTFTKAGTYPYYCAIHAGMDGSVTVQ